MPWTQTPIHFIDFEGSLASGILEYGVVVMQGGGITATHTRTCRAQGYIRPEDAAVHRLTAASVADRAPFADDFELFAGCRERGPLAAHFSGTENGLLKSVWPYPRTSPDFFRPGSFAAEWGPWIDSARLCAEVFPRTASLKLETLIQDFGLQDTLDRVAAEHCPVDRCFYHAALYDALAGGLVLLFLMQQPAMLGATLPRLLRSSIADGKRRQRLDQDSLF
jgi:DNA polymerase-3 subunit epsilon